MAKQALWDQLTSFVTNNSNVNRCLYGEFNLVCSMDERKGSSSSFRQHVQDVFNNFIENSFLVDSPICGRLFTWYRGDGYSMSRLDR